MGSLVGILVQDDSQETQSKRNSNRNSDGRKKRGQDKATTETKYRHYVVDENFNAAREYDAKGEFLSDNGDALEIKKSLQQGKLIGFGFFNPISMYRTFIFCHESNFKDVFKDINDIFKTTSKGYKERTDEIIEMVMRTKIKDAIRSRMLLNLPSSSTNSYRLINGEGDGLSGLAVDILGGKVAVMMASAAWVEIHKPIIIKVMRDVLDRHPIYGDDSNGPLDIVWRNTPMRLRQDGYELPNQHHDIEKEEVSSTPVILTENDIKYYAYPYDTSSQKTGFYCDQRENRFNLSTHCENKKVLDLCCFNGGFALNAMIHGRASSCVGVDSSQQAVDSATANARLNNLDAKKIQFIRQDI
jgi:23S rRNA G2069 N7-methylase RlmK/C1962 C5-methylase RlmI